MKYIISISEDAEDDLNESYIWYEYQKLNLGVDFTECISDYFDLILKYPEAFPVVLEDIRRVITKKFPYSIYYKLNKNEHKIEVIAILHNSRSPEVIHKRF